MERDELAAWLRLTLTPGVGNETARKLLAAFGLPQALFTQTVAALQQVVTAAQAVQLQTEPAGLSPLLATTWDWLCSRDLPPTAGNDSLGSPWRHIVALGDAGYPPSLLNIEDPPLMLYLMGAADTGVKSGVPQVEQEKSALELVAKSLAQSIAIVGSRNPTPQGLANAHAFAKALGEAGLTVVSGLALGIDGAAHEGALADVAATRPVDGGHLATVAVVGTGLDRVYPKSHRDLAHRITRHGLIISEYPLGTPPLAANFPRRNRIIAGLSQGTLVIEAALKSGSLITARLAAEQGKEVFAIPGSIHAIQSRGCHALIRQGAKLVESAQDVLEDMKLDIPAIGSSITRSTDPSSVDDESGSQDTDHGEEHLLQALGFDPVSLDALQARTGLGTPSLQAQLMSLELDGKVARLPGGLFQRMASA